MEKIMNRLSGALVALGLILFILGACALDSTDNGYLVAVTMCLSGVFSTCLGLLLERLF